VKLESSSCITEGVEGYLSKCDFRQSIHQCKKKYKLDVTLGDKRNLFADETGKWIQNKRLNNSN
jgi:hypothetical protein